MGVTGRNGQDDDSLAVEDEGEFDSVATGPLHYERHGRTTQAFISLRCDARYR